MNNIFYIDESGSMAKKNNTYYKNKYFIICILRPLNKDKLKRVFKRFISSNLKELRTLDKENKMFYNNGKFKELKGSFLNVDMKKKFINYFCRNNLFELYFIVCHNQRVKPYFYDNTARAFNYVLKKAFEHLSNHAYIPKSQNYLLIDERNVKTGTKATLEEYLNTELVTGKYIQDSFSIKYHASETIPLIQIADVFSNIFHTNLLSPHSLNSEVRKMLVDGYIKKEFSFPLDGSWQYLTKN